MLSAVSQLLVWKCILAILAFHGLMYGAYPNLTLCGVMKHKGGDFTGEVNFEFVLYLMSWSFFSPLK